MQIHVSIAVLLGVAACATAAPLMRREHSATSNVAGRRHYMNNKMAGIRYLPHFGPPPPPHSDSDSADTGAAGPIVSDAELAQVGALPLVRPLMPFVPGRPDEEAPLGPGKNKNAPAGPEESGKETITPIFVEDDTLMHTSVMPFDPEPEIDQNWVAHETQIADETQANIPPVVEGTPEGSPLAPPVLEETQEEFPLAPQGRPRPFSMHRTLRK
jgi:hypothetical protein